MRILIHSRAFLPNVGGIEQATYILARELTSKGHTVVVATDVPAEPDFDSSLPYEVLRGRSANDLARVARRCDLIHANGASVLSTELAMLSRRPLVVTHQGYQATCLEGLGWHQGERCNYQLTRCIALTRKHGGIARAVRQLARYPLGRAQVHLARANVAVSEFVGRVVDAPRTSIVHNCADTSVFKPEDRHRERTHLLFLGRFVGEKGVDTLLRAVAHSWQGGEGVLLDLVGSGPLEAAYRNQVEDLGIPDRVRFNGPLRGEQLAEAIRSCLAVVVPSTWDEAFGIVAAEALSCGRLAIVSNRGGLPEVVEGMDTVVPEGDIPAWAAALTRAVSDAAWRASQEQYTATAAARFTPDRFVAGHLRVYEKVLGDIV